MLTDAASVRLRAVFGGSPPQPAGSSCLNGRHRQAGCDRCVAACPAGAIQLTREHPDLQSDCCVHCGLCRPACPVDVFGADTKEQRLLGEVSDRLPAQPLAMICPLHPEPQVTAAPAAIGLRYRRCLGALSLADLLALTDHGRRAVWLDDGPCIDCLLYPSAQRQIRSQVSALNELLQAYGIDRRLHVVSETALDSSTHSLTLIDWDRPKMSRRDLFAALRRPTEHRLVTMTSHGVGSDYPEPPASDRLLHAIPDSRRRLLEQLVGLFSSDSHQVDASSAPFASVQVDIDRCSACGLCARFCPTGALRLTTETSDLGQKPTDSFILEFVPRLCLDCSVCTMACPEDAVTTTRLLDGSDLQRQTPKHLHSGVLGPCAKCGVPTAQAEDGSGLCYVCRSKDAWENNPF